MIKFIKISGLLITLLLSVILGLNFWIVSSTESSIYYSLEYVPSGNVALLLGTSKRTVGGGTNKYWSERIAAASELYRKGIVKHIIVSGDNNTVYYNEPRDMSNALIEQGVPLKDITLDYAGFRTLDSVVRAKEIFGQDNLVIISQDFHCYRALFIARYYNINAVAYSADFKDELPMSLAVREILARVKTILDLYVFNTGPKFLGQEEAIPS